MLLEISHHCIYPLFVQWYYNVVATESRRSHCVTGRRSKICRGTVRAKQAASKRKGIMVNVSLMPQIPIQNIYPPSCFLEATQGTPTNYSQYLEARIRLDSGVSLSKVYGMSLLVLFSFPTHGVRGCRDGYFLRTLILLTQGSSQSATLSMVTLQNIIDTNWLH